MAVSRKILAKIAMGTADMNNSRRLLVDIVERMASAPLKANMVTRDRKPEQAATTSRVVCAR